MRLTTTPNDRAAYFASLDPDRQTATMWTALRWSDPYVFSGDPDKVIHRSRHDGSCTFYEVPRP